MLRKHFATVNNSRYDSSIVFIAYPFVSINALKIYILCRHIFIFISFFCALMKEIHCTTKRICNTCYCLWLVDYYNYDAILIDI